MNAPSALLFDFLSWIDAAPRTYIETMDAWRTSCPRLPVWEDAVERGLVRRERVGTEEPSVVLTSAGAAMLGASRVFA
jgi:hypothetical protein